MNSKPKRVLLAILLLFPIILYLLVKLNLPDVSRLKDCITTKQNKIDLCPNQGNYVKLEDVSPWLIKTLVYTEDTSFYSHSGLDYFELWQSFKTNMSQLKYKRGASTLTQQLAKNVFFESEKTLSRKILEVFTALKIEEYYTKNFILEKYINVVEFGDQLYGLKKASQFYFSKPPIDLTLVESVFLVYLLPNPKTYQKVFFNKKHTEFSQKRMIGILKTLNRFKIISEEDLNYAKNEVLSLFQSQPIDFSDGESEDINYSPDSLEENNPTPEEEL